MHAYRNECSCGAGSPRIGTKDYAKEAPILQALDEGKFHVFFVGRSAARWPHTDLSHANDTHHA